MISKQKARKTHSDENTQVHKRTITNAYGEKVTNEVKTTSKQTKSHEFMTELKSITQAYNEGQDHITSGFLRNYIGHIEKNSHAWNKTFPGWKKAPNREEMLKLNVTCFMASETSFIPWKELLKYNWTDGELATIIKAKMVRNTLQAEPHIAVRLISMDGEENEAILEITNREEERQITIHQVDAFLLKTLPCKNDTMRAMQYTNAEFIVPFKQSMNNFELEINNQITFE